MGIIDKVKNIIRPKPKGDIVQIDKSRPAPTREAVDKAVKEGNVKEVGSAPPSSAPRYGGGGGSSGGNGSYSQDNFNNNGGKPTSQDLINIANNPQPYP